MWQAESVERTPRRCRWQEQNSRETLGLSLQLQKNEAHCMRAAACTLQHNKSPNDCCVVR
jgi:hypothetical protein